MGAVAETPGDIHAKDSWNAGENQARPYACINVSPRRTMQPSSGADRIHEKSPCG